MAEEPKNPVPDRPAGRSARRPAGVRRGQRLARGCVTDELPRPHVHHRRCCSSCSWLQGFFTVQSDQKAIILRFGAYEEGHVKDQGIHFAFPYPIDRVVPIWVRPRKLEVNTFWKKARRAGEGPEDGEGRRDPEARGRRRGRVHADRRPERPAGPVGRHLPHSAGQQSRRGLLPDDRRRSPIGEATTRSAWSAAPSRAPRFARSAA